MGLLRMNENYKRQLEYTGEILESCVICPFCFKEDEDAWEYNLRDGDSTVVICGECEQEFQLECSISVNYISKKEHKNEEKA